MHVKLTPFLFTPFLVKRTLAFAQRCGSRQAQRPRRLSALELRVTISKILLQHYSFSPFLHCIELIELNTSSAPAVSSAESRPFLPAYGPVQPSHPIPSQRDDRMGGFTSPLVCEGPTHKGEMRRSVNRVTIPRR
ncbi:hypothetical protein EV127DRAFT_136311 [Xylaria flabelliformis]|nr:hypothetical protein EV127DRAFT_136311 [Xylaria flabelliformis]